MEVLIVSPFKEKKISTRFHLRHVAELAQNGKADLIERRTHVYDMSLDCNYQMSNDVKCWAVLHNVCTLQNVIRSSIWLQCFSLSGCHLDTSFFLRSKSKPAFTKETDLIGSLGQYPGLCLFSSMLRRQVSIDHRLTRKRRLFIGLPFPHIIPILLVSRVKIIIRLSVGTS